MYTLNFALSLSLVVVKSGKRVGRDINLDLNALLTLFGGKVKGDGR